jgi:hypothetical protein
MSNIENTSIEKSVFRSVVEEEKYRETVKFIKEKQEELNKNSDSDIENFGKTISPILFLSKAEVDENGKKYEKAIASQITSLTSLPLKSIYSDNYHNTLEYIDPNIPISYYNAVNMDTLASSTVNNILSFLLNNLCAAIDRSSLMDTFPDIMTFIKEEIVSRLYCGINNVDYAYGFINNSIELVRKFLTMLSSDKYYNIKDMSINSAMVYTACGIVNFFLNNISFYVESFITNNMNNVPPAHILNRFTKASKDGEISSEECAKLMEENYTITDSFCDRVIDVDPKVAKICKENPKQINAVCSSWLKYQIGIIVNDLIPTFQDITINILNGLKSYNLKWTEEYRNRICNVEKKYGDKNDENDGIVNCIGSSSPFITKF